MRRERERERGRKKRRRKLRGLRMTHAVLLTVPIHHTYKDTRVDAHTHTHTHTHTHRIFISGTNKHTRTPKDEPARSLYTLKKKKMEL